jgi:hypothetical protein
MTALLTRSFLLACLLASPVIAAAIVGGAVGLLFRWALG